MNQEVICHSPTIGEMFSTYLKVHAMAHSKSWKETAAIFRRYLRGFVNVRLDALSKVDIMSWHSTLSLEKGKGTANQALRVLKTLYNRAGDWGLFTGQNPTSGIKPFRIPARERFLRRDEIELFLRALNDSENPAFRDFVLMCLYTGARMGNVLSMEWKDIDLEGTLSWHIRETKDGTSHTVPLVTDAIDLLTLRKQVSNSRWVFPGPNLKKHYAQPHGAWRRLIKRSGLTDLRIHDLRRSHASWQAITGASLPIIGKTLNHKNPASTAIYARLQMEPVRQAMEHAVSAMLSATKQ